MSHSLDHLRQNKNWMGVEKEKRGGREKREERGEEENSTGWEQAGGGKEEGK